MATESRSVFPAYMLNQDTSDLYPSTSADLLNSQLNSYHNILGIQDVSLAPFDGTTATTTNVDMPIAFEPTWTTNDWSNTGLHYPIAFDQVYSGQHNQGIDEIVEWYDHLLQSAQPPTSDTAHHGFESISPLTTTCGLSQSPARSYHTGILAASEPTKPHPEKKARPVRSEEQKKKQKEVRKQRNRVASQQSRTRKNQQLANALQENVGFRQQIKELEGLLQVRCTQRSLM